MHWIVLALIVVAAAWDLRTREVPDWIPVAILACATLATLFGWSEVRWIGLVVGLFLGFALPAAVWWLGGLGGADVKLIAGLGAALGPISLLCFLFWTALAGGLLAAAVKSAGKKDFAYVPAIAVGLSIQTLWPEGLRSVLLR